ncbi:unnamed protein product [Callosobruchus maculatus]|uniref:Sushi domain-containing protein n=1 Tax=Callosobruchus maculatus TaxID=64391 RepID=A0A653BYG1_CALMS|nr:unnamed protein product [Callosobruchus maculatus]
MSVKSIILCAVLVSILGIFLASIERVDSTTSRLPDQIPSNNEHEEHYNNSTITVSTTSVPATSTQKQPDKSASGLITEKYKKPLKRKKVRRRKLRRKFRKKTSTIVGNDKKLTTTISYAENLCKLNKAGYSLICNQNGTRITSCLKGFRLTNSNKSCIDIDECKLNNGQCEGTCINTLGSYTCKCPKGFRLSENKRSCEDVNECILRNGHGPCQDTCENTIGSYRCNCGRLNGTILAPDGHRCEDINECLVKNGGCSHKCINAFGKSFCSCPDGMELASDWKTCQDINECEDSEIIKSCPNSCINVVGSYRCLELDLQSDQSDPPVCRKLSLPRRGFFNCSRNGAHFKFNRKGRQRVVNNPGTSCELHCPIGYRLVGEHYVVCGLDGQWIGNTSGRCKRSKPPRIKCPPSQELRAANKSNMTQVKFQSPATNVPWKFVKSYPRWGKDLESNLTVGRHTVNFIAKDPRSKMYASCSFTVTVIKPSDAN